MSKIEELIEVLCPEGVEWKELGNIMTITRGASPRPIMDYLADSEDGIPWIKIGDVNSSDTYITKTKEKITSEGAKKSRFLKKGAFILSNSMSFGRPYILAIDGCIHDGWISMQNFEGILIPSFLNHLLRSDTIQNYWKQKASSGTVQNLNADIVRATKIPVPPLPIQQEIANILDTFTSLQAELEAELEARKKQYEYYRNELLNFEGKEVEWKTLGEVCENIISGKNTLKAIEGDYPVYGSTGIIGRSNHYTYDTDCLLIARVGANAGFVYKAKGKFDVSDNTLIIRPKETYSMPFAYFQLLNIGLNKFAVGGGQPLITAGLLKKLKIPIPPLAEQERIVAILDKFDALVNDPFVGLPAEIEARRKQYEYYRNKLLSFQMKSHEQERVDRAMQVL